MILGFKKVSFIVLGFISSLFLTTIIHVDTSNPWFDIFFIIPPILGGIITGWLNKEYEKSMFIMSFVIFLPLLILGVTLIDHPNSFNDGFVRLIAWFICIQIGGKVGSTLYQKLFIKK